MEFHFEMMLSNTTVVAKGPSFLLVVTLNKVALEARMFKHELFGAFLVQMRSAGVLGVLRNRNVKMSHDRH